MNNMLTRILLIIYFSIVVLVILYIITGYQKSTEKIDSNDCECLQKTPRPENTVINIGENI